MPRPSGKAAISLKGNAMNLPDIQLSHMAYQEHFKDVYTEDEIRKLLARPKTNKFTNPVPGSLSAYCWVRVFAPLS